MRRSRIAAVAALAALVGFSFARRDTPRAAPLDPAADFAASVRLATLVAAERGPETTLFGRVVDPVPLVDAALQRGAARRALAFAGIERRRVEALHAHDKNASQREVEAARLAAERAGLDLSAASARLATTWGAEAAARPDLDALAERLAGGHAAVARLDLPAGEPPPALDRHVQVSDAAAGSGAPGRSALLLGAVPTADPLLQGGGFLVLLEPDPPPVGTSLVARVPSRAAPVRGVFVPASAVVWQGGEPSVFVAKQGGGYERRTIQRSLALEGGWIAEGSSLAPGERVVVSGAQSLLSAERLPRESSEGE